MRAERIYNLTDEQQGQDSSNGEGENADAVAPTRERETTRQKECGRRAHCAATPGAFGQVLDAPEPKGDDTVAEQAGMEDSRRAGRERRKT
ncbi:hypothetical protein H7849_13130 [Alloacidobacterium dinghuense]|uniref:Uncharacterized protein n=1 Tax=Alloacidobacterium dinghuense TaxID=2763107 RepID=A0A7G8BC68_9BACT|nr:hypothetical protein [Alloacidobacterium dinghuense]QNI30138.1 hypothetical protein H7849_13130 [Alloacidobacterium dinghuense]